MKVKSVTLTLLIGLVLMCSSEAFAAKEKFVFVDIKKKANASLEKEWWTGNPVKTTYALLPLGKIDKFDGPGDQKVEFKIEKKALVLYGNNCQQLPKKIEGIKIDPQAQKIKYIYFLHATGWEDNAKPSYTFTMHYADKKKEVLELQSAINSEDWCHIGQKLKDKNSVWGWIKNEGHPCDKAGLITTRWENPRKDIAITSIDIESLITNAAPIIPAITLGDVVMSVDPKQKLASQWGRLKQIE